MIRRTQTRDNADESPLLLAATGDRGRASVTSRTPDPGLQGRIVGTSRTGTLLKPLAEKGNPAPLTVLKSESNLLTGGSAPADDVDTSPPRFRSPFPLAGWLDRRGALQVAEVLIGLAAMSPAAAVGVREGSAASGHVRHVRRSPQSGRKRWPRCVQATTGSKARCCPRASERATTSTCPTGPPGQPCQPGRSGQPGRPCRTWQPGLLAIDPPAAVLTAAFCRLRRHEEAPSLEVSSPRRRSWRTRLP